MYMDNVRAAEWLEERNIVLEKGFVEELQDLMITYKKRTSCVHWMKYIRSWAAQKRIYPVGKRIYTARMHI